MSYSTESQRNGRAGFTLASVLLLFTFILSASCGSKAAPPAQPKPAAPAPRASAAPPAKPPASKPSSTPVAASPAHEDEDSAEPACPTDMVLVEGDYCTDDSNQAKPDASGNTPGAGAADLDAVEHECLEEWYAPQNKKRVCEKFAEKSTCKGKLVKKRYCIDRYEWSNRKGELPEVMNRFHQAQVKCAAVGKRLCTESEWTFACEGPEMKPFPYGYDRDVNKCHGDEEWDAPNMTKIAQRDPAELQRLYLGRPSGQPECVSDFGVYDLPGNADEVVASETFGGSRGKYDSITTGGPWYKGVRNQCRPKIYTHDEGFYYYYLSFRCCAEPDGAATDPRTPHQKKEGTKMETVERTAGITVKEMRELLEKKKTDPTCGCKTTKCRTFCGTLHGDTWARDRAAELRAEGAKKPSAPSTKPKTEKPAATKPAAEKK